MALERTILIFGVITLTLAMAAIAPAEPAKPRDMPGCNSHDRTIAQLGDRYGESLRISGLGVYDTVVEIFPHAHNGRWTLTTTHPDSLTCLLTSGQTFERPVTRPPTRKTDRDKGT